VIQTFADFGLIGLAITAALLVAWCMATARAIEPRTGWTMLDPRRISEREGLVTLALVVLAFGLQSAIDWTWFFPGVTVPILLCAGWLAGRGPLARPVGRAARRAPILNRPGVGAAVTVLMATALLGAWLIWQPLRSANAANAAETAGGLPAAFASARSAADYDPLSLQPLLILSSLYESENDLPAARSELVKGVNTQPDNYESWLALGTFDLNNEHNPERSLPSLRRAVALNPTVPTTTQALAVARLDLAAKQR
jgi:tetratricopeptide (TPR) repeat protein